MGEAQPGGIRRNALWIAVLGVALATGCLGLLALLSGPSDDSDATLPSLRDLATAYLRVQPGRTRASQLARLGFDIAKPNVEALSYLGVMERFMPRDSAAFDRLDAPLQACFEARDRCTAFVFKPEDARVRAAGMFSMFGIGGANAAAAPQVTLLVQDGRVAYKMINGAPLPAHRRAAGVHRAPAHADAAVMLPVAFRMEN